MTSVLKREEDRVPKKAMCLGGRYQREVAQTRGPRNHEKLEAAGKGPPQSPWTQPRLQNGEGCFHRPVCGSCRSVRETHPDWITDPHSGAWSLDLPLSQRGHRASRHRRGRHSRILRTLAPSRRPQDNSRCPSAQSP